MSYMLYTSANDVQLQYMTAGSAAFDLSATENTAIPPLGNAIVSTGIAIALEEDEFAILSLRSGMGFKHNLLCHIGIIDSDYRGEVKVKVFNMGAEGHVIMKDERFAQLTILKKETPSLIRAYTLPPTDRGTGGFGSTGISAVI